jgi:hypothetical protein
MKKLFLPSLAFVSFGAADITVGVTTIPYLTVNHYGGAVARMDGNDVCLDATTNGGKAMLTAVITAHTTGAQVTATVGSTQTNCTTGAYGFPMRTFKLGN